LLVVVVVVELDGAAVPFVVVVVELDVGGFVVVVVLSVIVFW
jgi:hypothetical protein